MVNMKALSRNSSGEKKEKTRRISVKIAGNPAEIRTGYLADFKSVALPLHQSARPTTKDELKSATDNLSHRNRHNWRRLGQ